MALLFDRKSFRSGVQVVKEPATVDGVLGEAIYRLYVKDKGKEFTFLDEDYVLSRYPVLFTRVI